MRQLTYQNSHLRIINEKIIVSNYYYLLVLSILVFLFIINTPYKTSYNYSLVRDESYKLVVDDNYFLIKNRFLYQNHKRYSYSVNNISEAYIMNNKKYYNVDIDIKNSDFENDKNIYNITIHKNSSTLFNDFLKKLKKG